MKLSSGNKTKIKKLKCLILDVDGVLTDGRIFWIKGQGWTRQYHTQDGYGMRLLIKSGFPVAIFSGGESDDLRERIKVLGVEHAYIGNENKLIALEEFKRKTGFKESEMAFIGDELFDLPVLNKVGFSATVPHACEEVRKSVDYVTEAQGGMGAVREVIEMIRSVHKITIKTK
ncbi:MAG: HAD hydrolase family protein [Xanthomonadaceae bacterium]|nr:HAD hydrolase family protein [Xanthomonadaceae bacterium]